MSFTNDVKKDILTLEYNDEELKAELYGILKLKLELVLKLGGIGFEIKTASLNISRRIIYLIKKLYGVSLELKAKERANLDHMNIYYLSANEKVIELLIDLGLMDNEYNLIDIIPPVYDEVKTSVIRGFFLSKGSINDPMKSRYHLEISSLHEEDIDYCIEAVKEMGIDGKKALRRGNYIFYLKKGEQIGDFLKYLNAFNTMFEFEDSRIKRDLKNTINRCMNCDIANAMKTQETASKQIEDIKLIEKYKGLQNLSIRLLEAIELRTQNPDSSLSELSAVSYDTVGREISKSGLSHCFHDLKTMADGLRNENKL